MPALREIQEQPIGHSEMNTPLLFPGPIVLSIVNRAMHLKVQGSTEDGGHDGYSRCGAATSGPDVLWRVRPFYFLCLDSLQLTDLKKTFRRRSSRLSN